ncbi:MAG: hypothetical protein ACYC2H_07960 [Thermoplasmatota archaeon]
MLRSDLAVVLGLLLATLVPGVAACTSSPGPFHAVRFVVTEGEATILDLPTDIRVGPNDLCGYDNAPRLSFDGRFAAWMERSGALHVVDVTDGQETDYPRGVFTDGHLALLGIDGLRPNVTLVDLANGTSRVVDAPIGQSFVKNFEGAVLAKDLDGDSEDHVSVLDPVSGAWLLHQSPLPSGNPDAYAGSRDWIVFGYGQGMRSLSVATGEVAPVPQPAGPDQVAYGIAGDRLYLRQSTSSSMSWGSGSTSYWSVLLPSGTDRQEGTLPDVGPQQGRSASFVVQPGSASTSTNPSTGVDTSSQHESTIAGDATADFTPTTGIDEVGNDAGVDAPASAGLGAAAMALLGLAFVLRRRLA